MSEIKVIGHYSYTFLIWKVVGKTVFKIVCTLYFNTIIYEGYSGKFTKMSLGSGESI